VFLRSGKTLFKPGSNAQQSYLAVQLENSGGTGHIGGTFVFVPSDTLLAGLHRSAYCGNANRIGLIDVSNEAADATAATMEKACKSVFDAHRSAGSKMGTQFDITLNHAAGPNAHITGSLLVGDMHNVLLREVASISKKWKCSITFVYNPSSLLPPTENPTPMMLFAFATDDNRAFQSLRILTRTLTVGVQLAERNGVWPLSLLKSIDKR
jgi:hypothetical protein